VLVIVARASGRDRERCLAGWLCLTSCRARPFPHINTCIPVHLQRRLTRHKLRPTAVLPSPTGHRVRLSRPGAVPSNRSCRASCHKDARTRTAPHRSRTHPSHPSTLPPTPVIRVRSRGPITDANNSNRCDSSGSARHSDFVRTSCHTSVVYFLGYHPSALCRLRPPAKCLFVRRLAGPDPTIWPVYPVPLMTSLLSQLPPCAWLHQCSRSSAAPSGYIRGPLQTSGQRSGGRTPLHCE